MRASSYIGLRSNRVDAGEFRREHKVCVSVQRGGNSDTCQTKRLAVWKCVCVCGSGWCAVCSIECICVLTR